MKDYGRLSHVGIWILVSLVSGCVLPSERIDPCADVGPIVTEFNSVIGTYMAGGDLQLASQVGNLNMDLAREIETLKQAGLNLADEDLAWLDLLDKANYTMSVLHQLPDEGFTFEEQLEIFQNALRAYEAAERACSAVR